MRCRWASPGARMPLGRHRAPARWLRDQARLGTCPPVSNRTGRIWAVPDKLSNRSVPHQVLGVSPWASEKQIRRAYLSLAKRHHPDRGGDAARFDAITKAWKQLSELDSTTNGTSNTSAPPPRPAGRHSTRAYESRPNTSKQPEPLRFIPPLADGPVQFVGNPTVTVD